MKWGVHLVFSVGGKMFAIFDLGDAEPLRLKVSPPLFPILLREPGISPGPHLARAGWIRLEHLRVLPRGHVEELLRESHALVAEKLSRRLRRSLGIAEAP